MNKKVIENKEPRCEYCLRGKLSADGETVLCIKKGITDKDFSCKKFKYDPLKRVPKAASVKNFVFSSEDFEL